MEKDCWHYLGSKDRFGYGRINGTRVHRIAYEMWIGPLGDKMALHKCDYPPCFNPKHLFKGTSKDNLDDAVRKGRHRYNNHLGEENGNAILCNDAVEWIRANYQPYIYTAGMLAAKFGVKRRTIYKVLGRESWVHIKAAGK